MAKKKPLRERTVKDFSFEELVRLKVRLEKRRLKLRRKVKKEADILIDTIKKELEERGFGKEAELKQSIRNQKIGRDEAKN